MKIDRKFPRGEGDNTSKLIHLIQKLGYNADVKIELATVTQSMPDLKIKIDGMKRIEFDADDLIVAEHLTDHTKPVTIRVGDGTLNATTSGGDSLDSFELIDGEIIYQNGLKEGERVIVASDDERQIYYVLDRVGYVRF